MDDNKTLSQSASTLSVLIAEPSKTGRHIFAQLTSRLGVRVVFTSGAEETLVEAAKAPFDLVCLSQKLPDGEGVEVCSKLRKMSRYLNTTVLLVTPQKSSVNYEQAFGNGVTQLIGRHELNRFVHAVELIIERSKPIEGKVLVVEDSRAQAEYLSVMLKEMGLEVTIVCSAEQAVRELAQHDYSLTLIDVVLAGSMTGVELVDFIRTLPEPRNRVRILATSAYEDPSRRIQLFNLGIDDFIHKPIVREELVARVRGLLSQHYILATEKENQRLNHSLSQLMVNSPDLIARFDLDGFLLFINPQMERELEAESAALVGRHYSDLGMSEQTVELYNQSLPELLARGSTVRQQLEDSGGTDYDIQFSPETIDGKMVSFITSARDITLLTTLQKELVKAKESVEAASEAKSRFLAAMSHELRTPLNAISGFQQLLKREINNGNSVNLDTFGQYLELIGENSEHLKSTISEILDLSQIESDKLKAHYQSVRLKSYFEGIKASFLPQCTTREIHFELDMSELKAEAGILDKAKTMTVINNLLDNAIKFSHHGGEVVMTVRCEEQSLLVKISDEGVGIPANFLDRLFKPFEQVDNSRTRAHGGIGLGLSIADKFTRFLGGRIEVVSSEGQGTEVNLTLPLDGQNDYESSGVSTQSVARSEPQEPADNTQDIQFRGQKVLVVEDSLVNQHLMRACLDSCGLKVEVAENGYEAIEKCQQWRPDLILMDMHMPKMDGMTATTRIRELDDFKALPIFGLSADAHQDYIDRAIAAGATDYLTKPVDFYQLYKLMAEHLETTDSKPSGNTDAAQETAEPEPVEEEIMSEESVLNVDKGIAFAANNSDLYKQLLGTFVNQYQDSVEQMDGLYRAGNYDEAMKLAHTMKGVCSTLGMDSLSDVAKQMQFAFANEALDDMEQLLSSYGRLHKIALREATEYCA